MTWVFSQCVHHRVALTLFSSTYLQLILAATEQFNKKPKQGISFLMEQGILASPLDPSQVADFLHENPGLGKAKIGDYVGDRRNSDILESFVKYY